MDNKILEAIKAGAEKLGLKIHSEYYEESPGEEGAYAHRSGWSYYITW